jgi:FkbM family methyltransferase
VYWIASPPGFAVRRYFAETEWKRRLVDELKSRQVNVVLDVGANSGQYARSLRAADFEGRIVSFEPLSRPFSILKSAVVGDPLWDCRQCALGDHDGTIAINVSGDAGVSSSVLPMLSSHQDAYPRGDYIGTEEAAISRLDSVTADILRPDDVAFLKIDVQGFEKQVLAGAESTVNHHCIGMQLELSFMPLYEGDMPIQEALDLTYSLGFRLRGYMPFFMDVRDGRVLQADGVFFRADD